MANFTLELLHVTDQEASSPAVFDAPNLSAVLNALRAQDIGADGLPDNTLTLSSGDAFIPGLFYDAAAAVYGSAGIADIQIQNELGFQAIALGNHEFDFGTGVLAGLIDGSAEGSILGMDFGGTDFPYLSANLDFSLDANLAPLAVAGGQAPQGGSVTSSTVITVGDETIAVIGATTPTLDRISSAGDLGILPGQFDDTPTPAQLDALAAVIQAEVDAVLAADPTINKVILSSHMQRIAIEQELATRLTDVDIIIAGGSNTRLFDENDRARDGDSTQGTYPIFATDANGDTTAIVNTDGSYKYVGRLVIDFDEEGKIVADSYDATVSGAYATDAQGVADLNAAGLVDPEVQQIADEIGARIIETESNVFGISDVFLNGNRSGTFAPDDPDGVRTQETNLGNLTADANLAAAKVVDDTVVVSIKNGGGIRASIGQTIVPPGETEAERSPTAEVRDGDGVVVKPAGGISQTDIQKTLAFNNGLSLITVTRAEMVAVLEHAVSGVQNAAGSFPQISGLQFSFDADLPAGERVLNAAIVDDSGAVVAELIRDGVLVGDADQPFRIVTLNFLAGGGDGYPFPQGAEANRVDLYDLDGDGSDDEATTGAASFAFDGTEQDALAEYLDANFNDGTAFTAADAGPEADLRIQNIGFRPDTVLIDSIADISRGDLTITEAQVYDSGVGEAGSEVVAFENGVVYTTNGEEGRIDAFNADTGVLLGSIDLTGIAGFDGVQSVAVKNGIVAAAIAGEDAANGFVAFFSPTGQFLGRVEVGNLPDNVSFTPDGSRVLVANEAEPIDGDTDPAGSVSIIDLSNGVLNATVNTLDFAGVDLSAARIVGDRGAALDVEPEYIATNAAGTRAYVSLQEANAYATVDLTTNTILDVKSFGTVDHSLPGNGIDSSDRDGTINITARPVQGLRMPDAIATFAVGGTTYLVTANEGDARDLDGDETRLSDAAEDGLLDPALLAALQADGLLADEEMGRLNISAIDGDTDGDGDIDELYSYGSRGFTIFDADTGAVVFDSGDDFAQIIANVNPLGFNDEDGTTDENRSDNKGVEPEAVTIGTLNGTTYAFIGLERDGGIMVYDVTDPANSEFVTYFNGRDNGDVSPETLTFVAPADSPTGFAQLIAAYEVSGTTVAYDLTTVPDSSSPANPTPTLPAVAFSEATFPGTVTVDDSPVTGRLEEFNGATFDGVDDGDTFVFTNAPLFGDAQIVENATAGTVSFNGALTTVDANLTAGSFLSVTTGASEVTARFLDTLLGDGEDLREGQSVDPAQVDGIGFDAYLTGDGSRDYVVTAGASTSAFANTLGAYEIDASGAISNVRILFENSKTAAGTSVEIDDVAAGSQLQFFLIQNGADLAAELSDTLVFDTSGARPMLMDDGAGVDAEIFHSASTGFNSDGVEHFLSGATAEADALRIGIEDLVGGGDRDYQDMVFTVDIA